MSNFMSMGQNVSLIFVLFQGVFSLLRAIAYKIDQILFFNIINQPILFLMFGDNQLP